MLAHTAYTTQELRRPKLARKEFKELQRLPIRVVLDGVRQHYNIGAIFRLCDGFLIEHVYICNTEFREKSRKFVQASRGTHRWVPWSVSSNTLETVQKIKNEGFSIAALEQARDSITPEAYQSESPICLVVGSENDGVCQEVLDISDIVFELPILGMTNSYNVSTAAAITLYGLFKQKTSTHSL